MRLSSIALSRSSPLTKLATVERLRELRELHQEALLDFAVRTTKHYERPEPWLRWPNYSTGAAKGWQSGPASASLPSTVSRNCSCTTR